MFMVIGASNLHISETTCRNAFLAGVDVYAVHYTRASYDHFNNTRIRTQLYANRFRPGAQKMRALAESLQKGHLQSYSHVWIVDDNVKLSQGVVEMVKQSLDKIKAIIYQPAIQESHIPVVRPNRSCAYRYTDYVEIMSPIIGRVALEHALKYLHRSDTYSDWGLDMLWCKWLATSLAVNESTACVVLDAAIAEKVRKKATYSYARALNDKRCTVRNMKQFKTKFYTFFCRADTPH